MKADWEAKRLVDRYLSIFKKADGTYDLSTAKECAAICAERNEEQVYTIPVNNETFNYRKEQLEYWKEVRRLINKEAEVETPAD